MANGTRENRDPGDAQDWKVYAEATCAGLSALIPLPFVDMAFEAYFRRRMPAAVASSLDTPVEKEVLRELGRIPFRMSAAQGCLWLPLRAVRYVLRKIWRKVVYFLAIADAVEQVGYYWHRARLIEHLLHSRRFEKQRAPEDPVFVAFHEVLSEADTSLIRGTARKVVRSVQRVGRLLLRARRCGAQASLTEQRDIILDDWTGVQSQLGHIVATYERLYGGVVHRSDAGAPAGGSAHGE